MVKYTIVSREPRNAIPEEFRKILLEKHTTGFGYVSPSAASSYTGIHDGEEDDLTDSLNKVEDAYKDDRIFYVFVEANGEPFNFESFQPFNLLGDKNAADGNDDVFLSVMVEGEFPEFEGKNEDGEAFTSAYHFATNVIKEQVDQLADVLNGDLAMIMKALNKESTKKKLMASVGEHASVWFVPNEGDAVLHAKNDKAGSWPWGFATDDLGYKTVVTGKADAPEKKLSRREEAEQRKAQATGAVAPIAPKPQEKAKEAAHPAGGAPIIAKSEAEKTATLLKNKQFYMDGTMLRVRPEPGTEWKAARTWHNRNSNLGVPKDAGPVYKGIEIKDLKDDSPLKAFFNRVMADGQQPKEAENEQAENGAPEQEQNKPKGFTLLIPNDKKQAFVGMRQKEMFKPCTHEEAMAALDTWPPASAQLGIEFKELAHYAPEALLRLAHMGGAMGAALLNEFRCAYLDLIKDGKKPSEQMGPQKQMDASKARSSLVGGRSKVA